MEKYTDYNDFAYIYNRYWGDFPLQIMPVLEELVLKNFPAGTRILDVCCGTGQLAGELIKRGYEVTGIDSSDQMLKYARENAPTTPFIPTDARAFMLMARFNIAFSTFDSLNHLLTLDDLEMVFNNVYRQLETSGIFVFDMNLESGFLNRWIQPVNIADDDAAVMVNSRYDQDEKLATADITMFKREDEECWKRSDVTLTQRAYSIHEVFETLAAVGFIHLEVFDAVEDFKLDQVGRAFFRAKKR
jgi:SAM-dependent methyltransferase